MKYRIDPLVILIAAITAWSIAAAYRIAVQVPSPENIYFNYGTIFLIPAFIGLDYVRIRFGIKFSLSLAVLAVATSFAVNGDTYQSNYWFAAVSLCTGPLAILVGGMLQKALREYPIWEMAVITHVCTNIAHSIFFQGLWHYNDSDYYKYIYVSISFKIIMFLFSLPVLLGGLRLTLEKHEDALNMNSATKYL